MEKTFYCPSCSNTLLKITMLEEGEDVEKYICDICDISYTEEQVNPSKNIQKKK